MELKQKDYETIEEARDTVLLIMGAMRGHSIWTERVTNDNPYVLELFAITVNDLPYNVMVQYMKNRNGKLDGWQYYVCGTAMKNLQVQDNIIAMIKAK